MLLNKRIDALDIGATGRAEPIRRGLPVFKHGGIVVQCKGELQIRDDTAEIVRGSHLHHEIMRVGGRGRSVRAVI